MEITLNEMNRTMVSLDESGNVKITQFGHYSSHSITITFYAWQSLKEAIEDVMDNSINDEVAICTLSTSNAD